MTDNNELKLGEQAENDTYARLSGDLVLIPNDVVNRIPDESRIRGTVLLDSVDDDLRDEIREESEPVDVQSIVVELSTGTYYTEREAEFWALKNLFAMERPEISDEMELSKSRVDAIRRQVVDKDTEAIVTLRKTGRYKNEGTTGSLPE